MSCNCKQSKNGFACICDAFEHPLPLEIAAGLSALPRQIAGFPEFRRAMLRQIPAEVVRYINSDNTEVLAQPLQNWRARHNDDFGLMLLEMWAYVADVLSLYDEAIANETYLRTGVLRPSLRKLIALLGYLPRPAIGSLVELAAIADGRQPVLLSSGTAFRSSAFDGNPAQVFELETDKSIHPLNNLWKPLTPHAGVVGSGNPLSLLISQRRPLQSGEIVFLSHTSNSNYNQGVTVTAVEKYRGVDGLQYTRMSVSPSFKLASGVQLSHLQLQAPAQSVGLWTLNNTDPSVTSNKLVLASQLNQLAANQYILVGYNNTYRWFRIQSVADVSRASVPSGNMVINGNSYSIPAITVQVTEITLDASLNSSQRKAASDSNWTNSQRSGIRVWYDMQLTATITDEPKMQVLATDMLRLPQPLETVPADFAPNRLLFSDKNESGVAINGGVNFSQRRIVPGQGSNWQPALTPPLQVYGNALLASRGETVLNEIMGSGDASLTNQTFKLKKKPLTYLLAPSVSSGAGIKNTLSIWVNGVKWNEVRSFFKVGEADQVYIVRQNDEGETLVTFGDGKRGQRLPSGRDNIVASYRFGGEAALPPAGAVNQIGKPVKGLQRVKNVTPAYGGADAEEAEDMRTLAPASALVLGRIVSLYDMEAVAKSYSGVASVSTSWRWNPSRQNATAHLYYAGDAALSPLLSQQLRSLADPTLIIAVEQALPKDLRLDISLQIDERYAQADVIAQVRSSLLNADDGFLAPGMLGIGQPIYRSQLFNQLLDTEGVIAVQGIFYNGFAFQQFAITPGTGQYFLVTDSSLRINGQ